MIGSIWNYQQIQFCKKEGTSLTSGLNIEDLGLDKRAPEPLFRQLYLAMRSRIVRGIWAPGMRLPSSRKIANRLGVSRNTVLAALDQLTAEGYLSSKPAAGVWVNAQLPDLYLQPESAREPVVSKDLFSGPLSAYGKSVLMDGRGMPPGNSAFAPGVPALDAFPRDIWRRLGNSQLDSRTSDELGYGDVQGYRPLREAITEYVTQSRAVQCTEDQVVITHGAQQALDLCARVLIGVSGQVAMEEPGYKGARRAFAGVGAQVCAVPVDEQGLSVAYLKTACLEPDALYVTPAHQYPLGYPMSAARRVALLNWAKQVGCWIIEDDYDGEFHFQHRPLASLQGLSESHQVIYMGSFSKTLFPALRLGYLIVPDALVDIFVAAKHEISGETCRQTQQVTAAFMAAGHFEQHLKKMRALYAERWQLMIKSYEQHLSEDFGLLASAAGMHLVLGLRGGEDPANPVMDQEIVRCCAQREIWASPLSSYYWQNPSVQGLVLGFANSNQKQISEGIKTIRSVLRERVC